MLCTLALSAVVAITFCGCVTVYQPLVGLQRPTVVDFQQDNFAGQKILVRCLPEFNLNAKHAQLLCRKISKLFSNQGAEVQTLVPSPRDTSTPDEEPVQPDLIVDTKVRLISEQGSLLLAIASVWTFTLVPNIAEYTFAQDVTIRDKEGFALAATTLQARFIRYVGLGVWGVNGLADWLVRNEDEKLGGKVAQQDFSRDLYRQLSQLTFTAMMRAKVLHSFADAPVPTPPTEEQR